MASRSCVPRAERLRIDCQLIGGLTYSLVVDRGAGRIASIVRYGELPVQFDLHQWQNGKLAAVTRADTANGRHARTGRRLEGSRLSRVDVRL